MENTETAVQVNAEITDEATDTVEISAAELEQLSKQAQALSDVKAMYQAAIMGITPESIDDALTLAKKRVTDGKDIEQALSEIIALFPNFSRDFKKSITTGTKTAKSAPAPSGVVAAFLRKNPGIRE
jgi:predicted DNA-binding protein (UPF0251 family)